MNLPQAFFITGTDTDVGKTFVALELIRELKRQGKSVGVMKPIAAGAKLQDGELVNEDAQALIEASGCNTAYKQVNPYLFERPVSPHIEAQRTAVLIDPDLILRYYRNIQAEHDVVVVEGAGGWFTPVGEGLTLADLARKLQIPVVLVVGMKLGCLNHAELTFRAIEQSGLAMAGWIANSLDPQMDCLAENIQYLKNRLQVPLLTSISYKNG